MKRGLLALAAALLLANLGVVVARQQKQTPEPTSDPLALFESAMRRHDYKVAYPLTDLGSVTVSGGSSAISRPFFAAFARAHPLGDLKVNDGLVHIPTTNVTISTSTGPLPNLSVDGVAVALRASRVNAGSPAAAYTYRYAVAMISGPHTLAVGAGFVTAARSLAVTFQGATASSAVSLSVSSRGDQRVVAALDAITRGCPGNLCLVAPCSGRGGEFVLDAWGIGTPPIVGRVLAGDRVIAPMPPDGWSIVVTFRDQGQPPGLGGHEKTEQIVARYVFGFDESGRGTLLDRCWVSHQ